MALLFTAGLFGLSFHDQSFTDNSCSPSSLGSCSVPAVAPF